MNIWVSKFKGNLYSKKGQVVGVALSVSAIKPPQIKWCKKRLYFLTYVKTFLLQIVTRENFKVTSFFNKI